MGVVYAIITLTRVFLKKKKLRGEFDNDEDYFNYNQTLPSIFGFGFMIYFLVLLAFVIFWDYSLISVIATSVTDNRFGAFEAQNINDRLIKIGPRVVGTVENDVHAVELISEIIEDIINNTNDIQEIAFDKQVVSGSYYLDDPFHTINVYRDVQNLIVKISGSESNNSVLVNAHFDTVPESPGAGDDGTMCSVMLEVLAIFSRRATRPKNNVIFLFNGAEETALQASHGFITQHPWAKSVRVVVNLEAAGTDGREMLFQTGPKQPWLLDYYSAVPHPHAQVAAEEAFQMKIIPSDTDFRVFRDFGNIGGYDMALTRNGYRYHTKYDDYVEKPVFRHTGDNVLVLVEQLSDAPELNSEGTESESASVYYDFMGLFLVHYNRGGELGLNLVFTIFSTLVFIKGLYDFKLYQSNDSANIKYILLRFVGLIVAFIFSSGFALLLGMGLDALNCTMRWYNKSWLILPLYCVPIVAIQMIIILLLNKFNKHRPMTTHKQSQFQLHVNNMIWTVFVFIGTLFGVRSVYILLYHVIFSSVALLMISFIKRPNSCLWIWVYILALLFPTMFGIQISLEAIYMNIPVSGRQGSDSNPEIMVALLCALGCLLACCYYIPLISMLRNAHLIVNLLAFIFLLFLIVSFTPTTDPYDVSSNSNSVTPHRYSIFHHKRTHHYKDNTTTKSNAGYTFVNTDRNSPRSVLQYVTQMGMLRELGSGSDCDDFMYCGVAVGSARSYTDLPKSAWIPSDDPVKNFPEVDVNLILKSKNTTSKRVSFKFEIKGPDRMNVFFAIPKDVLLVRSNLLAHIPNYHREWKDKKLYNIMYTHSNLTSKNDPWVVELVFKVPDNVESDFLNFAVAGKYIHDVVKSKKYEAFLSQFPDFVALAAWVSTYDSWVF